MEKPQKYACNEHQLFLIDSQVFFEEDQIIIIIIMFITDRYILFLAVLSCSIVRNLKVKYLVCVPRAVLPTI